MNIQDSLNYFRNLLDKNGILQFTKRNIKNYNSGYAIEDQARALILAIEMEDRNLIKFFYQLLMDMVSPQNGVYLLRHKNGKIGKKTDNFGEASAEVFWALSRHKAKYKISSTEKVISYLLDGLSKQEYSRVIAYTLLGLTSLKDRVNAGIFAEKLIHLYTTNASVEWEWFENKLTYANALLPWSLFKASKLTKNKIYMDVALKTLTFILGKLKIIDVPIVVGNKGWWERDKEMVVFDQQPIDIAYMCLACLAAFEVTKKKLFLNETRIYYSWFHGNNVKQANMIRDDGACFDGLTLKGPKMNAGAESNICYLLASINVDKYKQIP